PDDGALTGLAFIKAPAGYWIEKLAAQGITEIIEEHT
ncbi:lactoylglutathione lyase, partial [Pseudoalteromonas sp. S4389]